MSAKTKVVAVRVDQDFYELLKKNGGKNISEYIKNLIVKGMMCELDEIYQRAENFSVDSLSKLSENNDDNIMNALNFLQELTVRIAIKQGYRQEDIKAFYQNSQKHKME